MDTLAAVLINFDNDKINCHIQTDNYYEECSDFDEIAGNVVALIGSYKYIFVSDMITEDFLKNNISYLSELEHLYQSEDSIFYFSRFFSLQELSCKELYNAAAEIIEEWNIFLEKHPNTKKKLLPKNYKKLITKLSGIRSLSCSSSYFNTTDRDTFTFFSETHRGGIIDNGTHAINEIEHGLAVDVTAAYHSFEPFATYPILSRTIFTRDYNAIATYIQRQQRLLEHGLHRITFTASTGYLVHIYLKGLYPKSHTKADYFKYKGYNVSQLCPIFITLNALEIASLLCDYEMSFTIIKALEMPLAGAPLPVQMLRRYAVEQKEAHKGRTCYMVYKQGANTLSGKDQYNRLQNKFALPLHCDNYFSIGNYDTMYTRLHLSHLLRSFWKIGAEICDIATDGFTAKGVSREAAERICKESDKIFPTKAGKLKVNEIAVIHYPSGDRAEYTEGKGRFFKVGGACKKENARLSELLSRAQTLHGFEVEALELSGSKYHLTTRTGLKTPHIIEIGGTEIITKFKYTQRDDII